MIDIPALRALLAESTPGKWYVVESPWGAGDWLIAGSPDPHGGSFVADTEDPTFEESELDEDEIARHRPLENAALIAAAVNALPALLDELEAWRNATYSPTPALLSEHTADAVIEAVEEASAQGERIVELEKELEALRADLDAERLKPLLDYEKQTEAWRARALRAEAELGALRVELEALQALSPVQRKSFEQSVIGRPLVERAEKAEAERDALVAERDRLMSEIGIPPGIVPAPGELRRWDEGHRDAIAQLTAWRNATHSPTPADLSASVAQHAIDYAELQSAWREATGCDSPEEAGEVVRALGYVSRALDRAVSGCPADELARLRELERTVLEHRQACEEESGPVAADDTDEQMHARIERLNRLGAAEDAAIAACRAAREGK